MKLLKPPPSLTTRHTGGVVTAAYTAGGQAIIKSWPRRRRQILDPVTEQQVAAWDDVLRMTKYAVSEQRIEALDLSNGTGFYARDLIISSCYGHTVSWPGSGVYFNGPDTVPLWVNSRGVPTFPPRALGDPQPVNIITSWQIDTSNDPVVVSASTYHEAGPTLFMFCCKPQKIPVYMRRRGEQVIHGYKLFFPCQPAVFTDEQPFGNSHTWSIPYGTFSPACPNCAIVVAEPAAPPLLDWCSLPFKCPDLPPFPPNSVGYWYISVGGSAGPTGYVPPQPVIDMFNQQMNDLAACIDSRFIVHEHRGYLYQDAVWIPSLAGMTPGLYKLDFCPGSRTAQYKKDPVDNETPNLPQPGTWDYDWSFLLHVHT